MDFALTMEQKMIKESTKKCMKQLEPLLNLYEPSQPWPKELILQILQGIVPLGALGSMIPEDVGGGGMDCLSWGIVYEHLDSRIDNVVHLMTVVTNAIYESGTSEQKELYLKRLLDAEIIGCYAITEPNVGSNPSAIETKAMLEGDYYRLNGSKLFITNGDIADIAIVIASTDKSKGGKGLSRFIVDRGESPFTSRPIPTIIGNSVVAELSFEDCLVPKKNLLGKEGEALNVTLKTLQVGRCIVACEAVKLAQEAVDYSIQYAKERRQFGKPIGSFQLIQAKIAEMIAETEAARLLAYRALWLLDKDPKNSVTACSLAKFYATEAAVGVTSKAIQIHGAYGLSCEYPLEELFRRARLTTIPDGTSEIQKLIVGREVLGINAFA